MERIIIQIFTLNTFLFLILISCYSNNQELNNSYMENFFRPHFNDKTKKLEYILTGENARFKEGLLELDNLNIKFIDTDGQSIKSKMTTSKAYYNHFNGFLSSDKKIKYLSIPFDIEGVGFDASNLMKTIHIRKDVKIIIKSILYNINSYI